MPKLGRLLVAVIIASAVLIFSMPSHATCAWILWQKMEHSSFWDDLFSNKKIGISDDWHVVRSFDDKKQCVTKVHSLINSVTTGPKKANSENPNIGETVNVSLGETGGTITTSVKLGKDNHFYVTEYLCLPDTIDPRGKQ